MVISYIFKMAALRHLGFVGSILVAYRYRESSALLLTAILV